MLSPDTLQTGGLVAALLAAMELLKLSFSKRQARRGDGPPLLYHAEPPPSWWERIGRIEARLEALQAHDLDLQSWLVRIESKLDQRAGASHG